MTVVKGTLEETKTTDEFRRKWSRPWARLINHAGGYQLPPTPPEAYSCDQPLILLGDSPRSELVAAIQATGLAPQIADEVYPGPGKALLMHVWSPFALDKNVIYIGGTDEAGIKAGAAKLLEMVK